MALLALLSAAMPALADEWDNPGTGDWFLDANWLDNSALTGADLLDIDNVILSGGTLSPGNSIGTLNVTGDYTHDSDSTLLIEVNDAGSHYDGGQAGAAVELGRTYEVSDWTIQPLAGLQYVHVQRESYSESGADAANLAVNSEGTDSLHSSLGVNLSCPIFEQADANALLHLRASWNYMFLDDNATTARFADTSADSFTVDAASLGRHSAQLGAGVSWQLNDSISLGLQYDAAFSHSFVTHSGAATLSFVW